MSDGLLDKFVEEWKVKFRKESELQVNTLQKEKTELQNELTRIRKDYEAQIGRLQAENADLRAKLERARVNMHQWIDGNVFGFSNNSPTAWFSTPCGSSTSGAAVFSSQPTFDASDRKSNESSSLTPLDAHSVTSSGGASSSTSMDSTSRQSRKRPSAEVVNAKKSTLTAVIIDEMKSSPIRSSKRLRASSVLAEEEDEEEPKAKVELPPSVRCRFCEKSFSGRAQMWHRENHEKWRHKGLVPPPPAGIIKTEPEVLASTDEKALQRQNINDHLDAEAVAEKEILNKTYGSRRKSGTLRIPSVLNCEQCGLAFRTSNRRERLERHIRVHHTINVCPHCGRDFTGQMGYAHHVHYCRKKTVASTNNSSKLNEQQQEATPTQAMADGKRHLACPKCGKWLLPHLFRRHTSVCGPGACRCERCGKNFAYPALARHHRAAKHPHPCPSCVYRFTRLPDVVQHIREIHGEEAIPAEYRNGSTENEGAEEKPLHRSRGGVSAASSGMEKQSAFDETLVCRFCSQTFVDWSAHQAHEQRAHSFACDGCERKFMGARQLAAHKRLKHADEQPPTPESLECPECGKSFPAAHRWSFDAHRKSDHCVSCALCTLRFASPVLAKSHVISVHGKDADEAEQELRFRCSKCSRRFGAGERSDWEKHWRRPHPIECEFCDHVTFTNGLAAREHIRREHAEQASQSFCLLGSTRCSWCAKEFTGEKGTFELIKHRKRSHTVECADCERKFINATALREHREQMHGDEPEMLKCDQCEKSYSLDQKGLLREHKFAAHTHRCTLCPLGFVYRKELNAHITKVHPDAHMPDAVAHNSPATMSGKCSKCGQTFEARKLIEHERLDHREQCTECPRAFMSAHSLGAHRRVHAVSTGPPTPCDQCGRKFRDFGASYTEHMSSPHAIPCQMCDKMFISRMALGQHMGKHHGVENRWRCDQCFLEIAFVGHRQKHEQTPHTAQCEHCEAHLIPGVSASAHMRRFHPMVAGLLSMSTIDGNLKSPKMEPVSSPVLSMDEEEQLASSPSVHSFFDRLAQNGGVCHQADEMEEESDGGEEDALIPMSTTNGPLMMRSSLILSTVQGSDWH